MSTIFETLRDATLRPTATIFCWPRAIGSSRLPQLRVQHILLHFHALRRLCAHASYQHSKNCDSGWSGGKLDWLHQGMQVPKLSLLSSLTQALQLPGSGRLPLVRRDGSPHSVKSLCETTVSVLACRRVPTWVGALCFSTTCARMIQDTSRLNLTSTLSRCTGLGCGNEEPWKAVASLRGGTRYICSTANENDTDASGFEQSRPFESFAPRLIRPLNARIRGHSDL